MGPAPHARHATEIAVTAADHVIFAPPLTFSAQLSVPAHSGAGVMLAAALPSLGALPSRGTLPGHRRTVQSLPARPRLAHSLGEQRRQVAKAAARLEGREHRRAVPPNRVHQARGSRGQQRREPFDAEVGLYSRRALLQRAAVCPAPAGQAACAPGGHLAHIQVLLQVQLEPCHCVEL